jgi:membrane fusion protein (multidrug efflux system)
VRARVPGVLQRRTYEEGSDVAEGQVLFVIDPAPLKAALGQAEAAQAPRRRTTPTRMPRRNARARSRRRSSFRRPTSTTHSPPNAASAALQVGQGAVESARINLGYATCAPISGRAGKQQVTEGALVGQGDATLLTTVDQIDRCTSNFSMGVDDSRRCARPAMAASASAGHPARRQRLQHPGTLDFSGDVVDPATGAVALRARVPNPEHTCCCRAPSSACARRSANNATRIRVPQSRCSATRQGAYVMVVGADGKVARKT